MALVSDKDMEANEQCPDDRVKELVSRLRRFAGPAIFLSIVGCLCTLISIYLLAFGSELLRFDPSDDENVLLLLKWILMGLRLMQFGVPFVRKLYGRQAKGEDAIYVMCWTVVHITAFFVLAFFAVHPSTFLHKELNEHSVPANQSDDSEFSSWVSTECFTFLGVNVFHVLVTVFAMFFGWCLSKVSTASLQVLDAVRQNGEARVSCFTIGKILTVVYAVSAVLFVIDPITSWMSMPTLPFIASPGKLTTHLGARTETLLRGLLHFSIPFSWTLTVILLANIAVSGIRNWKANFRINVGVALHIATWTSVVYYQRIGEACLEKEYALGALPGVPYGDRSFAILDIVLVVACLAAAALAVVVLKNVFTNPRSSAKQKLQRIVTVTSMP